MIKLRKSKATAAAAALIAAMTSASIADACTRLVYHGSEGKVITARSMDWTNDIPSNLWIFPRGITRSGETGINGINWTSKYGSVVTSAFDIATADGVNEAGLMANLLWLVESDYPTYNPQEEGLTIAAWAQYTLDNFGTVAEAVAELSKEEFVVVTDSIPGEHRLATLHLSISDTSGDSAIFEYIDKKLVIHHGRQYQVMTNSPTYDKQLALNQYWEGVGGLTFLPGTNRAADRFARAAFYVNTVPKYDNADEALASVFSVIRNASVPYGISTESEPNLSSTRWRTVFDHKRKIYFFESVRTPNVFWVELKDVDFSAETGKIKTLNLGVNQTTTYSGNTASQFVESAPFKFLGVP